MNPYVYCLGDPINRSDSNGRMSFFFAGKEIIRQLRVMKNTGTIRLRTPLGNGFIVNVRPGIDRVHAMKERFRFGEFSKLSTPISDQNSKFMHDLSEARIRSEAATEITGILPREDPYLNFLESIRSEPPLRKNDPLFNEYKLFDLAHGDQTRVVSREQKKIREIAQNYYRQMEAIKPHNSEVFGEEANRIFNRNFRLRR